VRIEERFVLAAPIDAVFDFLSDVRQVAGCVPGVDGLVQLDDGSYTAKLKVQLGPIKAAFDGAVRLETDRSAYTLSATGQGRDSGSGSRAEVAFSGALESIDERSTAVQTVAEVTIRGRLGQFGTGVIRATATEVLRDFVACADRQLSSTDAPSSGAVGSVPREHEGSNGAPSRDFGAGATGSVGIGFAFRILRSYLRGLFRGRS
jgi:uncharacterized protein